MRGDKQGSGSNQLIRIFSFGILFSHYETIDLLQKSAGCSVLRMTVAAPFLPACKAVLLGKKGVLSTWQEVALGRKRIWPSSKGDWLSNKKAGVGQTPLLLSRKEVWPSRTPFRPSQLSWQPSRILPLFS